MNGARLTPAALVTRRESRPRRRLTACLAALALLAVCATVLLSEGGRAAAAGARPPIVAYRGLGVWVDLFDSAYWNDPAGAISGMEARGVRTLYIETSNWHWPSDLNKPASLSKLIVEAHAHGMKVVAWYLPQLKDIAFDLRRCKAALQFRTADGQKFDSFGLDIEDSSVKPVSTRTDRLLTLSNQLRAAVGSRYPLGAIIPSPTGMTIHSTFWPNFPYKQLAAIYDVMVPMGYYTYHVHGYAKVYAETAQNFTIVREQTGNSRIPIHVIGGMAGDSSMAEVQAYVRCVRQYGGLGASLYDYATTKPNAWQFLRLVPVNPRPGLPMPAPVGYAGILGNVPHNDSAHPKEVFFDAGTLSGAQVLHYRIYDAQKHEIRLLVNWKSIGLLPAGPARRWSAERTIVIPADKLNAKSATVIAFVARGAFPNWSVWGVRGVSLAGSSQSPLVTITVGDTPAPSPAPTPAAGVKYRTEATRRFAVRRGGLAVLRYRVVAAVALATRAKVVIRIRRSDGHSVKTIVLAKRRLNLSQTTSFRCRLKRGTYRYSVYASFAGAGTQTKVGSNRFVVR